MLDELVVDLVKREKRAVRWSFVYTGIALLLSGLWLAYTVQKTQQLGAEARSLEAQIAEKRKELEEKDAEILAKREKLDRVAKILKLSPDELISLYNYGWENNYLALAKTEATRDQIKESLQADKAREQIVKSTDNAKRQDVVIQYFPKDVDREKVESALRELGFKLDLKAPFNSTRTNAIWFGRQVDPEDARLVAFTLMRAGVQLNEIRYFKRGTPRANSSLIQVGSNPFLLARTPLTVDDVSQLKFAADK